MAAYKQTAGLLLLLMSGFAAAAVSGVELQLVSSNQNCWSHITGNRLGLGSGTPEECAVLAILNPSCGSYIEVDPANNNWCGCGKVGSSNESCVDDTDHHPSAHVYRILEARTTPICLTGECDYLGFLETRSNCGTIPDYGETGACSYTCNEGYTLECTWNVSGTHNGCHWWPQCHDDFGPNWVQRNSRLCYNPNAGWTYGQEECCTCSMGRRRADSPRVEAEFFEPMMMQALIKEDSIIAREQQLLEELAEMSNRGALDTLKAKIIIEEVVQLNTTRANANQ